jgi:hypothetical protein
MDVNETEKKILDDFEVFNDGIALNNIFQDVEYQCTPVTVEGSMENGSTERIDAFTYVYQTDKVTALFVIVFFFFLCQHCYYLLMVKGIIWHLVTRGISKE